MIVALIPVSISIYLAFAKYLIRVKYKLNLTALTDFECEKIGAQKLKAIKFIELIMGAVEVVVTDK